MMAKCVINYNVFHISFLIFSVSISNASAIPFKYNLNPSIHECGANVSRDYFREDTVNQALACMKKGFKSVYLGLWEYNDEKENIAPELRDFCSEVNYLTLGTYEGIKYYVLYTNEGVRNALLLQKLFLDVTRDKKVSAFPIYRDIAFNDYLLGKLLEYSEDDILFFYQRWGYLAASDQWREKWRWDPLIKWPQEKQDAFYRFVEKDVLWKVKYKVKYNKDKTAAQAWLKENEQYSIEDLADYNKNLIQALQPSLLERVSMALGQVSTSVKSAISRTVNYLFPSHK